MRLRFLPICLKVDRFPIEHRVSPGLALMRVAAPSLTEVATVAEAFGLQRPAASPRRIAAAKIVSALRRSGLLVEEEAGQDSLERRCAESIAAAVTGCAAWDRHLAEALVAQRRLSAAEAVGEPQHARLPLECEADRTTVLAAQAFVRARRLCEEVEGFVVVMEHLGLGMAEGQVARRAHATEQRPPAHGRRPNRIEPPRFAGGGNQQQRHDKTKEVRVKGPSFG